MKRCKSSQILGRSQMASTATTFNGTMIPVNQKSVEMILSTQPKNIMARSDSQFYRRQDSANKNEQQQIEENSQQNEVQSQNEQEVLRMEEKYFKNRHQEVQFQREVKEFSTFINNWAMARSRVDADIARKVQQSVNVLRETKSLKKLERYGNNENMQQQQLVQMINKRDKIIGDQEFQEVHMGLSQMIASQKVKLNLLENVSPVVEPKIKNESLYANAMSNKLGFENKSLTNLKKNLNNQLNIHFDEKYSLHLFKDHQQLKNKLKLKSKQKIVSYSQFDYPIRIVTHEQIPPNDHLVGKAKVNRLKFLMKNKIQSDKKPEQEKDQLMEPIISQFSSTHMERVSKEEVKPSLSVFARQIDSGQEMNIKKEKQNFANIFTPENIVRMKEENEIEDLRKILASRQISISTAGLVNSLYNPVSNNISNDQLIFQSGNQLMDTLEEAKPARKRQQGSRGKKR